MWHREDVKKLNFDTLYDISKYDLGLDPYDLDLTTFVGFSPFLASFVLKFNFFVSHDDYILYR